MPSFFCSAILAPTTPVFRPDSFPLCSSFPVLGFQVHKTRHREREANGWSIRRLSRFESRAPGSSVSSKECCYPFCANTFPIGFASARNTGQIVRTVRGQGSITSKYQPLLPVTRFPTCQKDVLTEGYVDRILFHWRYQSCATFAARKEEKAKVSRNLSNYRR